MHGKILSTDDTVNVCESLLNYCNNVGCAEIRNKAIQKIAFIEMNTILDNYYLSIKRGLGKEERNHHKVLYRVAKIKYKEYIHPGIKLKLFEKSPWLFYVAMMIFMRNKVF